MSGILDTTVAQDFNQACAYVLKCEEPPANQISAEISKGIAIAFGAKVDDE